MTSTLTCWESPSCSIGETPCTSQLPFQCSSLGHPLMMALPFGCLPQASSLLYMNLVVPILIEVIPSKTDKQ